MKILKKVLSFIICVSLVISAGYIKTNAIGKKHETFASQNNIVTDFENSMTDISDLFSCLKENKSSDDFMSNILKVIYNTLNVIVESVVKSICNIYPDPSDWKDIGKKENDNFMVGRKTYRKTAGVNNHWSLGYASESLLPEDVESGKYYIGRDLMNKKAKGVYDDQRIRVVVIDDNSGEGAVVFGSIDCLGVTSTDVRAIREGILKYCKDNLIPVASINIAATHCHSALDTQGVSTEFFYKLFANGINNKLRLFKELPFIDSATYFKNFFIQKSIKAVESAFEDAEFGTMSYGVIDTSAFVKDKRGLVSAEDLPDAVTICFKPNSNSEKTYITNMTCHPTSLSADEKLVGSDYIYYAEKYIKEKTGSNFMLVQGSLGQISRDIDVDTTGMSEDEKIGAEANKLGSLVGECVLKTDYSTELAPIINVRHMEILIKPENSILALACEVKLVNNKVYYTDNGEISMVSEVGYLEFGNKLGFAMFPGELYPEVFWGTEIVGNVSWDGTQWQYDSLHNSVDGVEVYPISLVNDATGYVLTDNNFAFMGHIIGDGIADEILSAGKHEGSFLIEAYLSMVNSYTKNIF